MVSQEVQSVLNIFGSWIAIISIAFFSPYVLYGIFNIHISEQMNMKPWLYSNYSINRKNDILIKKHDVSEMHNAMLKLLDDRKEIDSSSHERNITLFLEENDYYRFKGEYMKLTCPRLNAESPHIDMQNVFFRFEIKKHSVVSRSFPGTQRTILFIQNDDFGTYHCLAVGYLRNGTILNVLYSQLNVIEDVLSSGNTVFYPYPGSIFQINFPAIHVSPYDHVFPTLHTINGIPLSSIDQGPSIGCSFASIFFSKLCKARTNDLQLTGMPENYDFVAKIWLCYNSFVGGYHAFSLFRNVNNMKTNITVEFTVLPQTFIYNDTDIANEDLSRTFVRYIIQCGRVA